MSLLLDALKKAEKEKEEAQREARVAERGEPRAAGAEEPAQDAGRRVVTRAEPLELSQPLEILSEDLRAGGPVRPSPLAPDPESALPAGVAAGSAPREESPAGGAEARARVSGRARVEERFREPDPRLPFYVSVGVLGVLALCTIAYFWYQLRPVPNLANSNPPRPTAEKVVDLAEARPAASGATSAAPATRDAAVVPGLPQSGVRPVAPPSAQELAARVAEAPAGPPPAPGERVNARPAREAAPTAQPAAKRSAASPGAGQGQQAAHSVSVNRAAPDAYPRIVSGYRAYHAGDLAGARAEYEQVLREDPNNRDALLGLAAIEMRTQRYEQSEAYYERLLRADPRDAHALAGVLALRREHTDPVQAESRVKSMLASDPAATALYFTLGNQYALQGRWAEAEQAYFKAHSGDSHNPDFAFNLAVSLDRLRHYGPALEYYRRARALAEKRAASFDPEAARQRELQLSR